MHITFNGINSGDVGAIVLKQPPFIAAARRVTEVHTFGKDYRTKKDYGAIPYIMYMDIATEDIKNIDTIKQWLQGKGFFSRSDYPGKRLYVEIQSALVFERVADNLYKCNLGIWVQYPFWISESDAWLRITNKITNVGTYRSLPQFRIQGKAGQRYEFTIGDNKFAYTFPFNELEVIIDSREKTITNKDGESRTLYAEIGHNFPVLEVGDNIVTAVGSNPRIDVRRKDTWI